MNDNSLDRAAIFAALAEELDLSRVKARFGLQREDLVRLFREAALRFAQEEDEPWTLYCDGASRGNPGPAGAGFVLYNRHGQERAADGRYLGETTNNVAEYRALLLGLEEALKLGVKNLQVLSDSELMVRQIKGIYQVKQPHLLPLWQEAKKALQKFRQCAIAHVNRSLNHQADRLARQAIDRHHGKS